MRGIIHNNALKTSYEIQSSWVFWTALVVLLAYLSPYIIVGQDAFIQAFDNLDSNVIWQMYLVRYGSLWAGAEVIVPEIMNGLPSLSFGTLWNYKSVLYTLFEPFTAYVINILFIKLIAFLGMFLLLRKLNKRPKENQLIFEALIVAVSLSFAMTEFWPSGGLSVAGQPLLLYAFISIWQGSRNWKNFAVIALFPFFSNLILVGIFIIGLLILWSIFFSSHKQIYPFVAGIAFLISGYIVAENTLLYSYFFDASFISHREAFNTVKTIHGGEVLSTVKMIFSQSIRYLLLSISAHAEIHQFPFINLSWGIAFFVSITKFKNVPPKSGLLFLSIVIIICLATIYQYWLLGHLHGILSIFKVVDLTRILWMLPLAFYLLFFYCLESISASIRWGKFAAIVLVAAQIILLSVSQVSNLLKPGSLTKIEQTSKKKSLRYYLVTGAGLRSHAFLSYRQYYSTALFQKIDLFIDKPKSAYRILCLGFDPAIAQFNGFYTLDGYSSNYPLSYKQDFRKIIAKEIEKSPQLEDLFDNWGSKCYFFSSELDYKNNIPYTKDNSTKVYNLEVNIEAIREFNGNYIFSAVEIVNIDQLGLKLRGTFDHVDSRWKIRVYELMN